MQRIIMILLAAFSVLFFACLSNAAEQYTIDPNHSYVLWHISHFGFSRPSGKWIVTAGKLKLDKDKPQNSTVNVLIHVNDINTGIPELDKHLKDKPFFDVAKFPVATFVSNKVILMGKNKAEIHGTLTAHGIARQITLNVRLNKIGISPITHKETVGFTADTILKRSDFGITNFLPGLGDQVQINIEAEAYK